MIKQKLDSFSLLFENFLKNEISYNNAEYKEHYSAMEYSLLLGGKRLRPFILSEFYKAAGKNDDLYLNFAAALEMIHTYSLIHDDLPCMDDDDFRRGKPSCHKAFNEATALLAGDGLLTKAFETAANTNKIQPELVVKGVFELAKLAGADGMIGGQIIDLAIENKKTDIDTVLEMYTKKTGALLVAAAKIGVIISGGNEVLQKSAEEYAHNLGIAFQIKDDILDIKGDVTLLGKPVGSDTKNNKSTYVSLRGLENAEKDVVLYTEKAKNALKAFEGDTKTLSDLADYLIERKY